MGLADRDYQRRPTNFGGGFLSHLPPVVRWLLIINVSVFLLDYLVLPLVLGLKEDQWPPIVSWGAFSIDSAIYHGRIWEFITFQFIHGGFLHVLFNSFGLYFFGPWMEQWWGAKKFLIFYLVCGAAGAAFYTLLSFIGLLGNDPSAPLVGASAGIYGILIGVAFIAPNLRVRLFFPPIELTMRQLAIGLMIFATVKILLNMNNAGGEAGHLGGAILGFILMRYPQLLGDGSGITIHRPRAFRNRFESKIKPRTTLDLDADSEVDAILDKVSRDGFQSLTEAEREILTKAAARHRSDG